MIKSRAITLGCVSAFTVIGGLLLAVLLHLWLMNVHDGLRDVSTDNEWRAIRDTPSPVWACGMVYIIPGLLGFIAAFVQNKCMYVTTSIFSIISILIMGIIVVVFGFALFVMILGYSAIDEQCRDTLAGCECRFHDNYDSEIQLTPFRSCEDMSTIFALLIAIMVFVIVPWVLLLVQCVLVCYYACRSQPASHGTVYVPAQQPMLPPGHEMTPQYPPPGYNYPPSSQPYYDQGPPHKV